MRRRTSVLSAQLELEVGERFNSLAIPGNLIKSCRSEFTRRSKFPESESQRRGLEYDVANGETIADEGKRRCMSMNVGVKVPKRITCQVAGMHKLLLSISKASDAGYECHDRKDGACGEEQGDREED